MITYVKEVCYVDGYRLRITFNTGESAVVDFRQLIASNPNAASLRDIHQFKSFYLDEWPTLAWPNRHGASTTPNDPKKRNSSHRDHREHRDDAGFNAFYHSPDW